MSVDATKWAWSLSISPTRKIVLLSMADRAGETHVCWPSLARLEADTCLDRKTIMNAISELEGLGLIAVSRSIGCGNSYRLIGVNGRENDAKSTTPTSPKTGTGSSTKTGTGSELDTSTKNGTTTSTKNGTTTSTKNGTLNLPLNPNGISQSDLPDQNQPPNTATMAGAVCVALKAIGMGKVSPGNQALKDLLDAGADIGQFVEAGKKAVDRQKGFEYTLAIVKSEMLASADFANQVNASTPTASGILPGAI